MGHCVGNHRAVGPCVLCHVAAGPMGPGGTADVGAGPGARDSLMCPLYMYCFR